MPLKAGTADAPKLAEIEIQMRGKSVSGLVEVGILPVQDCHFQDPLRNVVI